MTTKAMIGACLLAALVAGCAAVQPKPPTPLPPVSQRDATEDEVALALEALKRKAKDPESVQIRGTLVQVSDKPGGRHMCGEFNAKNSYGGYVGFRPFWAYLSQIDGAPGVQLFHMVGREYEIESMCRNNGILVGR